LKHFKLVGPKTTREFDIEDDEMISWNVIKITDYESKIEGEDAVISQLIEKQQPMQNEKIYPTKDHDLK